jgi:hypothetical protein
MSPSEGSRAAAAPAGVDLSADAYRRRIRVETRAPGTVVAALEDDFHHFVVTLRHDGAVVDDVTCVARRWPWATCPDAAGSLHALAGMPLSRRFTAAGAWTDPKQNCTHQFDSACYAITHAARGVAGIGGDVRQYDLEVPRRDFDSGRTDVRLWVDGAPRLAWHLAWDGIIDPEPPLDTAPWRGGFMRWADATLPEDHAECAITLRRAADIGMGRGMDLESVPVAADLPNSMSAVCYSMQPGVVQVAFRNRGSIRDYAAHPERLLAD